MLVQVAERYLKQSRCKKQSRWTSAEVQSQILQLLGPSLGGGKISLQITTSGKGVGKKKSAVNLNRTMSFLSNIVY